MILLLIALLLLPGAVARAQAPTASDSAIEAGKKIWTGYPELENDCKLCHGRQGEGGFAVPLAGHKLTAAQFIAATRNGPGNMPSFVADKNLNDEQLTQVAAYLGSLPKPAKAAAWQTPVPPLATPAQKLMISTGCGQCHGPIMANPRRTAGTVGADFDWFKNEVYRHTSRNAKHLRMGNYTTDQVSEASLLEIWRYFADEAGLRVKIYAYVSAGVPGPNGTTYTIDINNAGLPGKGLAAEYVTVSLPFQRGMTPEDSTVSVVATTGEGYTGQHREEIANLQDAEFYLPRLEPGEKKTFTITLSGPGANHGITNGLVKWKRPLLGDGSEDLIGIEGPLGQ